MEPKSLGTPADLGGPDAGGGPWPFQAVTVVRERINWRGGWFSLTFGSPTFWDRNIGEVIAYYREGQGSFTLMNSLSQSCSILGQDKNKPRVLPWFYAGLIQWNQMYLFHVILLFTFVQVKTKTSHLKMWAGRQKRKEDWGKGGVYPAFWVLPRS